MSTDDEISPKDLALFLQVQAWARDNTFEDFERIMRDTYEKTSAEQAAQGGPTWEQLKAELPGIYRDARKLMN